MMYDYECTKCGETLEEIRKVKDRHVAKSHDGCGGSLRLVMLKPAANHGEPYHMKAVMVDKSTGQRRGHVKGHFGKAAKVGKKK